MFKVNILSELFNIVNKTDFDYYYNNIILKLGFHISQQANIENF